jgi:iron complex transport system substrate-binding protein
MISLARNAKLATSAKASFPMICFFASLVGVAFIATPSSPHLIQTIAAAAQPKPSRIVSVIPAVTEMLFAIGAGPQVVAVGSFDAYPPEVAKLPRVGALLDPDLERILAIRPDLVIVYESQTDFRRQLERAAVPTFIYKHAGMADIAETIMQLGTRIGRETESSAVVRAIEKRLEDIRARVQSRPRPSTLVVFGRDALALRGIYASGGTGFIHDMLEAAGGTNVFADVPKQAVQATTELILARRPAVILELRGGPMTAEERSKEATVWKSLSGVPAVRTGRVTIVNDPRTVVPGPRVAEGVELLARALHPDAFTK